MEYKKLGNSGLSIAPIIVGCMSYGSKSWAEWVLEDEEVIMNILKKCYDKGLRTFDTANVYSNGLSESLLKKFIEKYNIPREKIVILTKIFFPVDSNAPPGWSVNPADPSYESVYLQGLSRKHIIDAVNESCKRLGTYIDVLQIHRLDKSTPKAEIMRALNDIVLLGQARYIGASAMKTGEFAELQYIAEINGWFKFISMQNFYNLLYREEEREMIPFCNDNELGKVGLIPYSPVARGLLSRPIGKSSEQNRNAETDPRIKALFGDLTNADKEIIGRVEELSKKHDVTMAAIAAAWTIAKGTSPIVGLNSEKRVDDIIEAISLKLTNEEMEYLEGPYVAKAYTC